MVILLTLSFRENVSTPFGKIGKTGPSGAAKLAVQWPILPKIHRRPRFFFAIKTDGGIQKLT